jgi:hypothetical protein
VAPVSANIATAIDPLLQTVLVSITISAARAMCNSLGIRVDASRRFAYVDEPVMRRERDGGAHFGHIIATAVHQGSVGGTICHDPVFSTFR